MKRNGLMVFAVIAAAVLAFFRRRVEFGAGWVWPVPNALTFDGKRYDAVISDGGGSPRGDGIHKGVDVMYRRAARDDRQEYKVNTVNGSAWHFAPPGTPVLAARDGVVWEAGNSPRGKFVVLDHGKPWATFYQHLASLAVGPHARGKDSRTGKVTAVKAGDVIGYMGGDIKPGAPKIRHLHFEVWHGGGASNAVDPTHAMQSWARVGWYFIPEKVQS